MSAGALGRIGRHVLRTALRTWVGDIRSQEFRHWIEISSLRGVNIQRLSVHKEP